MSTASNAPATGRRVLGAGLATLLATGLLGLTAGAAMAGPMSGVDVLVHLGDSETVAPGDPPTACTFHLHFTSSSAKTGFYDIHAGSIGGEVVATGTFDTSTGDSPAPDSGVFALDEGTYLVAWDDEMERDPSFDSMELVVACEAETPTPTPVETPVVTPTPTPTGSEQPIESESPSPTGSELPITGTPTPTGSELPIGGEAPTGGVGGVVATPPATDVGEQPARVSGSNISIVLGLIAVVAGLTLGWARRLQSRAAHQR